MRSLWFAGATCGAAIIFFVYTIMGRTIASTTVIGVAIVSTILLVQEYRAARRWKRLREQEARRIAYFRQTGRWPTSL